MRQVNPVPEQYTAVTPYLIVPDCRAAIDLYQAVFGAIQTEMIAVDGSVMHAEIRITDAVVMLADANPDWDMKSPADFGGSPVSLYLYVPDADAVFAAAMDNGFEASMEMADQFWGDRFGQVKDPYGHIWSLATHIEDLSEAEINQRAAQMMQQ